MIPQTSRGTEWASFALEVLDHIENYTVPQYGDAGEDQIDDWPIGACLLAMIKYAKRSGNNIRLNQDKIDMLKIAHYACFVYNKLKEEDDDLQEL